MLSLLPVAAGADTILSPRSKAEHEADIKALNEKYGPARSGEVIEVEARPALAALPPAGSDNAATSAPAASPQRLRVTVLADGNDGFRFNDEVLDGEALTLKLRDLGRQSSLDSIVLLDGPSAVIGVGHILALAKIGKALKLPTMYQQGADLKSISAQ